MAFTSVVPWVVGNRLSQTLINKMVSAIQELQDEVTSGRPQLRVYAPATVTNGSVVPYANVRVDTHGGWSGSPNYAYTVAKTGMYLVNIQFKGPVGATSPAQHFQVGGVQQLWTATLPAGSYAGTGLTGVLTLAAGSVCRVVENNASYTPQNDFTGSVGTGSNYWHLTYLGPQ